MAHEPRLTVALHALLHTHRVAALGTLAEDGTPHVSMVPFAPCAAEACLVLHVSSLAAHTGHLLHRPAVSLLVMQAEAVDAPVHALPRVTISGQARGLEAGTPPWNTCRAAYLARFPEAEPMLALPDFRFIAVLPQSARQIAGFGAARSVDAAELAAVLRDPL